MLAGRVNPERHILDLRRSTSIHTHLMPEPALQELVQMARQIHIRRGMPQDIEWAYVAGQVFILQARPVTQINFDSSLGLWTTADMRDGGVSSYLVTPMMGSLYHLAFDLALNRYLKAIGLLKQREHIEATQTFFGKMYWNLGAVKQRAMQIPGFIEREFDRDLGIEGTYEGDGTQIPSTHASCPKPPFRNWSRWPGRYI